MQEIIVNNNKKYLIIGIGLNVNEKQNELNKKIEKNASSLKINQTSIINLELLLANILNELEKNFDKETHTLISEWEKYCNHMSKQITFHENDNMVSGVFTGINQNGQAIININNQTEFISSGIIEV